MQAVKDRLAGFFSPLTSSYLWRRLFPAQCWGRWPRSCWVPHPASQKLPWLPNLYGPAGSARNARAFRQSIVWRAPLALYARQARWCYSLATGPSSTRLIMVPVTGGRARNVIGTAR
jgi:hypothetical protein